MASLHWPTQPPPASPPACPWLIVHLLQLWLPTALAATTGTADTATLPATPACGRRIQLGWRSLFASYNRRPPSPVSAYCISTTRTIISIFSKNGIEPAGHTGSTLVRRWNMRYVLPYTYVTSYRHHCRTDATSLKLLPTTLKVIPVALSLLVTPAEHNGRAGVGNRCACGGRTNGSNVMSGI